MVRVLWSGSLFPFADQTYFLRHSPVFPPVAGPVSGTGTIFCARHGSWENLSKRSVDTPNHGRFQTLALFPAEQSKDESDAAKRQCATFGAGPFCQPASARSALLHSQK